MNFEPLFLTSRVVIAVYRTLSTAVLLFYLMQRIKEGKKLTPRLRRHYREYD